MKSFDYEILINEDRETMFMKLDWILDEIRSKIVLDDYEKAYEGTVEGEINEEDDIIFVLEEVYMIFNMKHPKDYKNRSLSVSDVVKLNDDYYFVDSLGFKKITDKIISQAMLEEDICRCSACVKGANNVEGRFQVAARDGKREMIRENYFRDSEEAITEYKELEKIVKNYTDWSHKAKVEIDGPFCAYCLEVL